VTSPTMDFASMNNFSLGVLTVTPAPTNTAPSLDPLPDRLVHAGTVFRLTVTAHDLETPTNQLTFSLGPGCANGTSIDPTNGLITWPTLPADAGNSNLITVQVADDGLPSLSATQSFSVT